jgi:hypothetical protein
MPPVGGVVGVSWFIPGLRPMLRGLTAACKTSAPVTAEVSIVVRGEDRVAVPCQVGHRGYRLPL